MKGRRSGRDNRKDFAALVSESDFNNVFTKLRSTSSGNTCKRQSATIAGRLEKKFKPARYLLRR